MKVKIIHFKCSLTNSLVEFSRCLTFLVISSRHFCIGSFCFLTSSSLLFTPSFSPLISTNFFRACSYSWNRLVNHKLNSERKTPYLFLSLSYEQWTRMTFKGLYKNVTLYIKFLTYSPRSFLFQYLHFLQMSLSLLMPFNLMFQTFILLF